MTGIPGNNEIETRSGPFVDVGSPAPASILLQDLASASARVCRFGGHTSRFYSVAEHAVLCSRYAERQGWDLHDQLACLHHDAAEAYLGDIPRPLKPLLGPQYKTLTDKMDAAIIDALGLPFCVELLHTPRVKEADRWALVNEARRFIPSGGKGWGNQQDWDLGDLSIHRRIRGLPGPLFRLPRP